jgi:putative flippase GtrA
VPARTVQRKFRGTTGKRFSRFMVAAVGAVMASQLTLTICLGALHWTAGRSALTAWIAGATVSYLASRWARERRGRPQFLRETLPFWMVAVGTAIVLTAVTKFANQYAISMGLSHVQRVVFLDGCFFFANFATFLTRFMIFHYLLFSERTSRPRSVAQG